MLTYRIRNWKIQNAIKRANFARDVLGDKVVQPLYIDWIGRSVVVMSPRVTPGGRVRSTDNFGNTRTLRMVRQSLEGRPPTLAQANSPGPFSPPVDLAFPRVHEKRATWGDLEGRHCEQIYS